MACKQYISAIISCKLSWSGGHVRARSLAAALTLGAGVALSAVTAAVSVATAQELEWATRAGGTAAFDPDLGLGIATDSHGNSYVTGVFAGTGTFGEGEDNETELSSSAGTEDIFVAKYDRNGQLLWATRAGGASPDESGQGIATDGRGTSYVTGLFGGTATFGDGEDNETELSSAGFRDIFVAKYDRNGELLWAKRAGGVNDGDGGRGIAIDRRGNSYVTGVFAGTATFGEGEANEIELSEPSGVFVAKYDRNGLLRWATIAAGFQASGIATDSRRNSYVTGDFLGTATFGEGEPNETVLEAGASADVFVAKYDRNGLLRWATKAAATGGGIQAHGIAADGPGKSYVTGHFVGTATFGEGEDNETELKATGVEDIFVAKYDRNGLLRWATKAGGASNDYGVGIATGGPGNSYVTGIFSGAATFGEGDNNETELSAAGGENIFVAKYDRNGLLRWATKAGGASTDEGQGIATDSHCNSYVSGVFAGTATFGEGEDNETELSSAAGTGDIFVAKYRR